MGKRELVLIFAFVVIGCVVYQVTAPADREGEGGFSIGRLIREIKQDIQGDRFQSEARKEATAEVPESIVELEVAAFRGKLTVIGEERDDVHVLLVATVGGPDQAEAERRVKDIQPRLTPIGESMRLEIQAPRQSGRLRSELTLHVPSRLKVRAEVPSGATDIQGVAAVALTSRGELKIDDIKGALSGEHRDGESTISNVGSMRLTLRRSDTKIDGVRTDSTLDAIDGDVELSAVGGRLRFNGTRSDLTFSDQDAEAEIKTTDGRVTIQGAQAALQIEGVRTRVEVRMAKPVPVQISTTDDGILLTAPPAGGIAVNAIASDGAIESEIATVAVVREDTVQRATGAVNGGGPTATLRATRGTIAIVPAAKTTVEK